MLCRETKTLCSEIHTNALCGQNVEIWLLKSTVSQSYQQFCIRTALFLSIALRLVAISRPLTIHYSKTSLTNYHCSLSHNTEQRIFRLRRGGSPKPRTVLHG